MRQLSEAATRRDVRFVGGHYKIEYHSTQQLHQFRRKNVVVDEEESFSTFQRHGTMIGWLKSHKSTPTCPGLDSTHGFKGIGKKDRANIANCLLMSETDLARLLKSSCKPVEGTSSTSEYNTVTSLFSQLDLRLGKLSAQASVTGVCSTSAKQISPPIVANSPLSMDRTSAPPKKPPLIRPRASFATAGHVPIGIPKPRASIGSVASIVHAIKPDIWKANTYSVMLVIDNREVQSQSNRDAIFRRAQQIMGHEANVQQRPLAVGDALWVAKHKENGKEVVLDSIVERKRLDDLCKSILDARFHEQKARLKNSGLADRIYLIESYHGHNNRDVYEQQIQTSQTELMLLDGFHLQITTDWKESVKYLTLRTRVLSQLHETIDLAVIPDEHVDRQSYLSLIQELRRARPDEYWVTSYNVFESLNAKSGNLTVQELWGRMMYHIPGMSAEKVGEFVHRWPTPRSFMEEFYRECSLESARCRGATQDNLAKWLEDQFSSGPAPNRNNLSHNRKRLGPALGRKIAEVFSLNSY